MLVNKKDSLQGKNSKRLDAKEPVNSEGTAAWQNSESNYRVDQVNRPSLEGVIEAKDWVDNGSQL